MATSTREKLVRAGMELFYQHGFHAVGLDRILKQVGVTKTTFYNHFESKESLICAAIEAHGEQLRDSIRRGIETHGGDAPQNLLAVFDALDEMFQDESFCGCPIGNALVEFSSPHELVHVVALRNKKSIYKVFRDLSVAAGLSDTEGFLQEYVILFEGALQARQMADDRDAAKRARRLVGLLLDSTG